MKHTEFQKASCDFRTMLNSLFETSEHVIPQAKYFLEGDDPHPFDVQDRESATEIVLHAIGKSIDELLSSFDRMLESINKPSKYKKLCNIPK